MPKLPAKSILACMTILLALSGVSKAEAVQGTTAPTISATNTASRSGDALSAAILDFNAKSLQNSIGKHQSPLTEEEVVAAIRLSERSEYPEASDTLFASFQHIAHTRKLPAGAVFEVLTGLDPGGDFIFDVWYVRIMLPKADGGTYSFTIRNRIIRARPVAEVAKELEANLKQIPPMPGRYRIEDRLQELKQRAAKVLPPGKEK